MKTIVLLLVLAAGFLGTSCAKNPEAFYFGPYSEAEQLYNKEEYAKAIEKYQAYSDENPEGNLSVISQYYIAKSYRALGQADQAKDLFQKIMSQHPDLVWAHFAESQLKEMGEGSAEKK